MSIIWAGVRWCICKTGRNSKIKPHSIYFYSLHASKARAREQFSQMGNKWRHSPADFIPHLLSLLLSCVKSLICCCCLSEKWVLSCSLSNPVLQICSTIWSNVDRWWGCLKCIQFIWKNLLNWTRVHIWFKKCTFSSSALLRHAEVTR